MNDVVGGVTDWLAMMVGGSCSCCCGFFALR